MSRFGDHERQPNAHDLDRLTQDRLDAARIEISRELAGSCGRLDVVETPLPHEAVTSPLHVRGTANTFEATFDVRLFDAAGRKLLQRFVTATSGSGTRGTYDVTLTFPDTVEPRWLEVFEPSAENGEPLHKVRIPLNG